MEINKKDKKYTLKKGKDFYDKSAVLKKVIARCRQAFQGKTPLIMLDTREQELAELVAVRSGIVDLVKPVDDSRSEPYYAFIGAEPDELNKCENLFTDHKQLKKVMGGNGDLDSNKNHVLPSMFVLHLTRHSWRNTTMNNSESEPAMIPYLRAYTSAYLRCQDNSAPLLCSCVLLYGDVGLLPEDLKPYTVIIDIDYPEKKEIKDIIVGMSEECGLPFERNEDVETIVSALAGFSLMDAVRHFKELLFICDDEGKPLLYNSEERDKLLLDAKKQVLLQNGGLLELQKDNSVSGNKNGVGNKLGGMARYRKWVQSCKPRMTEKDKYAMAGGVSVPKGVLLCGVPGCGKSEAARILQQEWGVTMLKMNVDQLMGGIVGDSERNMREALKQAEVMAPCILWVDELDKGFSGSSRNSQNSDTFKRMFGRFLTWMQEKKQACFIFATANDISQLPPEFFRSGRFDELFSVFMPTGAECIEIFREHMRRAEKRRAEEADALGQAFDRPKLFAEGEFGPYGDNTLNVIMDAVVNSAPVRFLSGADIEKIVLNALTKIVRGEVSKSGEVAVDGKFEDGTPVGALPEDKLAAAPIGAAEWMGAVTAALADPALSTLGSSRSGINSITACYVRLLRGNFISASEETLFRKSGYYVNYDAEKEEVKAGYRVDGDVAAPCNNYDKALFDAVSELFDWLATQVERNELAKLST